MLARVVLVADDDPAVRRLLRRLLGGDFTVLEAGDGEEAVKTAAAERPAVVLLDLAMPHLDGYSTLLRLQAEPALAHTPVLIVTGADTSGEAAAMCLRDGAHDFVRKPFEEVELLARVRAAFRHRAFQAELSYRNAELEQYASRAAHDLKGPLVGIAHLIEVLRDLHLDAATRAGIESDIATLADRGANLVGDLLSLARDDWASAALQRPIDTDMVMRSVLDDAHLADTTVRVDGEWRKVTVPEVVLRSMIANLVTNADHYGRDAAGHLDLSLSAECSSHDQMINVADQGPGLHPDVRARLFEPFTMAPDSLALNPRSTGLGLAVVARSAQRYGGSLALVEGRPAGTTLRLTVPLF